MAASDEKVNMESHRQYQRLSCQLFGKPVVIIADIKHAHVGEDAVIEKKLFTTFDHQNTEKTVMGRCVVCYSFISQNEHIIRLGQCRRFTKQSKVLTELLTILAPQPNLDIPVEKEVLSVSSSWFCRNCSCVCQQLLSKSKQEPVTELRERIIATIQLSMLIAEKQVNSAMKKDTDWNDHTSILLQTKAVDKIRECLIKEIKFKYKRFPEQKQSITTRVKVGVSKTKQRKPSPRFPCDICGAILSKRLHLQKHKEVVHLGIYSFACMECGRGFAREQDLDTHLRYHTGERLSCELCDAKFVSKLSLRRHVQKHHGDHQMSAHKESGGGIYKCDICGASLADRVGLNRHKRVIHLGIKRHACQHCPKRFGSSFQLISHSRLHTGEKPFACPSCDRRFAWKQNASRHVCTTREQLTIPTEESQVTTSAHKESGGGVYKCDICAATLASRDILNRHKRVIHFGIKRHACPHCQKRFGTRLEMTNHIRQHTGEKPFACPNCDRRFALKQSFSRHLLVYKTGNCQRNGPSTNRPFHCHFCSRRFVTKTNLNRHVKLYCAGAGFPLNVKQTSEFFASVVKAGQGLWKATEGKLYFCELEIKKVAEGRWLCPLDNCLHSCAQRPSLVMHINRTHADPSNYQCNECELKFYYEFDLVEHVQVQHGGRYSDEKLSNQDALNRHKSTVHGPSFPYPCNYCGKGFTLKCNLRKHVNSRHASHSGEKVNRTHACLSTRQFECGQCDAKFYYRSQLIKHKLVHTDGPFACNFCDQRFSLIDGLKQHVQKKHYDLLQLSLSEKDENEAVVAVEALKDEPCIEDEEKVDVVEVGTVMESDIILPEALWKTNKSFDPFQIY